MSLPTSGGKTQCDPHINMTSRPSSTSEATSGSESGSVEPAHPDEKLKDEVLTTKFGGKDCTSSSTRSNDRPWKLTLIRFGPLSGLFGLVLAIASIFAALGILVSSRNSPVTHWAGEPSTYLAICTAVANQAIRYATIQGVVIAWWTRASRGSTLSQLHNDYRAGTTLRGALTSGRHMGFLGIACIFSTLVAVDGPFLQKATQVVLSPIVDEFVPINITMAQQVPTGFSGGWLRLRGVTFFNESVPTATGSIPNDKTMFSTINLNYDLGPSYYANGPVTGVVSGCTGPYPCKATIRAPALVKSACKTSMIPVNYSQPMSKKSVTSMEEGLQAPPFEHTAFLVSLALDVEQATESLVVVTAFYKGHDCVGDLNLTTCSFNAATGDYDTIVANNSITFAPTLPRIVSVANNAAVNHTLAPAEDWHKSTLGGVVDIAQLKWETQVVKWYQGGFNTVELYDMEELDVDTQTYLRYGNTSGQCTSFSDPHEDVILNLNQLMFRVGAFAARWRDDSYLESHMDPGTPWKTQIMGGLEGIQNIYQSNFSWFAAAVIVELICVAAIAPTFWGWWKLGRHVSFSPLEIGKAFEAPLLQECNSNSSGNEIVKAVGDMAVQYGVRSVHTTQNQVKTKIAFAEPDVVSLPRRNSHFDV